MRKFLQMLITVGVLVCSGQFEVLCSDNPFRDEDDAKQFKNGVLRYTDTKDAQKVINLKFCDVPNGTFDLSDCGDTGQYLVITTSMDRFFKVAEENKGKTVILITPRYLVEQGIKTSPTHPFATLMANWEADKAPVGIFWRWGDHENLTCFDYLTTASMTQIPSCNLYENWRQCGLDRPEWDGDECRQFSCQFLNRNKN